VIIVTYFHQFVQFVFAATLWQNQGTNDTDNSILQGQAINLTAQGKDETALDWSWLATNESGSWKNYTTYWNSSVDWWNSSFQYRKPITISNSGSALTDYQVQLNVTFVSGKMNSDFSDLRFANTTGTELSYWIEKYIASTNATVWIKVSNIPTGSSTIYMYYGNTSATYNNTLGGNSTFYFFDDFSGSSLDSNKWTINAVNTITSSIVNGKLNVTGGTTSSNTYWIYDNTDTGDQHQAKNTTALDNIIVEWEARTQNTGDMSEVGIALVDSSNLVRAYESYNDGSGGNGCAPTHFWLYEATTGFESASCSETANFKLQRNSTTVKFYINNTLKATGTLTGTPAKLSIAVGTYAGYTFMPILLDNIRVRQFTATEPTASVGTEESKPSYGSPLMMQQNNQWQWSNFTWSNSSVPEGSVVGWRIYYNDTSGNENVTDIQTFTVNVSPNPHYQYVSVNDSLPRAGDIVKFSAYWWDLDADLNYSIFSWNASGINCDTWINETTAFTSGNNTWTNVSKTIPSACESKKIGWRFYANDSLNQWNSTDINYITVKATATLPAARNISAIQQNVTFVIATNTTSFTSGDGLRISYNITNLDKYCTKNFDTGLCDRINSNYLNLTQLRFYINDKVFYQSPLTAIYGLETYSSSYDLTVPTNYTPCFDIKGELVYYDSNDDENRIATSNVLQLGTCLAKNATDQPCRYTTDCQNNLFCLDSDNNNVIDVCKASSTSSGYLCELYGIGTKERISTDQSCKFAYPGSRNHNLADGSECVYREDCISSYCWDTNADDKTECSATQTSGSSTGIIVSSTDRADCTADACYLKWKCYSNGTIKEIDGANYTCTNGDWKAPEIKLVEKNISAQQQNVTFVIATNTTSFTSGDGLRISYNITNLDKYCTKNFDTGLCDRINSNYLNLTQLRFYINDKVFYQSPLTAIYGLETYSSSYDLTVPTNYTPCFDIKGELVYYDSNDDENRIATSNVLQLGTCLAKNATDQPCRYTTDCQNNLFCLDSDNNNVIDVCKASSTSSGYLCELYGIGTKERISTDQSCKFAYPGSRNHNLADGSECVYREDCISSYCWDTNADDKTECSATQTSGSSTGIIVSSTDRADCTADACYLKWKCYSNGTIKEIDGQNYSCIDGSWRAPPVAIVKNIYSTFRNITYKFTNLIENSTHISVSVTLKNNEASSINLIHTYLHFGDGINQKKVINSTISAGGTRTDSFVVSKPTGAQTYYSIYAESLISIGSSYYWVTSRDCGVYSKNGEWIIVVGNECIVDEGNYFTFYSNLTVSCNATLNIMEGSSINFSSSNTSIYVYGSKGLCYSGGNVYISGTAGINKPS